MSIDPGKLEAVRERLALELPGITVEARDPGGHEAAEYRIHRSDRVQRVWIAAERFGDYSTADEILHHVALHQAVTLEHSFLLRPDGTWVLEDDLE